MRVSTYQARRIIGALLAVAIAATAADIAAQQNWDRLRKDGIHDPRGPGVAQKQEPADALSKLTPDTAGNQVRWVQALEKGEINPRASIRPDTKINVYDADVLLNINGGMPLVRFPHRQHTQWLDCSNCHEHLFKSQAGANKLSMLAILNGEQCGVCHGAVSFPLTECGRCHSVPRPGQKVPASGTPLPFPGRGLAR